MDAVAAAKLVADQVAFFNSGATRSHQARKFALAALQSLLRKNEDALIAALQQDLGRPLFEAYGPEVALVHADAGFAKRHLRCWMRRRCVRSSLINFPARSWVVPEPRGRVLILSPWNYPIYLCLEPLIGVLAAGNCAVIKPSELAPASATVLAELVPKYFAREHVAVVTGGADVAQSLLDQRWDHIVYTGNGRIAREVMAAASRTLSPVTLELGGKNPAIVSADANLAVAARRIVWGKFFNAGQTCLAPDFVCIERKALDPFIAHVKTSLTEFFSEQPLRSRDFGRIINERHMRRLVDLLTRSLATNGRVIVGGQSDVAQRYIAPTVIHHDHWENPLMEEEIFGPILPLMIFDSLGDLAVRLRARPTPLALYFFSEDRRAHQWVGENIRSGGLVINGVFAQLMSPNLPFGGLGDSGMGRYHGKYSFDAFSHLRTVVRRATWLDPRLSYPPYRLSFRQLRTILPWLFR